MTCITETKRDKHTRHKNPDAFSTSFWFGGFMIISLKLQDSQHHSLLKVMKRREDLYAYVYVPVCVCAYECVREYV